MENKQTEKTQAELYREERKKRMESSAKKNAAKSPKAQKVKKIVSKVISIVLAVAIVVASLVGILNFFGIPQKVLTAAKIGDVKVSTAKYNYYYMDVYLDIANQSKQYDSQYGAGAGVMYTGYDSTKSPMEQEYTQGTLDEFKDSGKTPTWADAIRIKALDYVQSFVAYSKLARDAGIVLTDAEKKSIDEQIEQIRKKAADSDFAIDRYLIKLYGKGVTEKLLREVMEERTLASNYAKQKQEELSNNVTDVIIEEEYSKNIQDYANLSLSIFVISPEEAKLPTNATEDEKKAATAENLAKAKAKAEGYVAKITSPETFLKQAKDYDAKATSESIAANDVLGSEIKSTFGDNAVKWCFDANRKVGDVTYVEGNGKIAVLYMNVLPHKDMVKPVNVRHILFQFPQQDDQGKQLPALTPAQKLEYKNKAQAVYDEYLKNPTEENFAALATKNTEDTGSKEKGGLYESVAVGDMVAQFNDWCFDPIRKVGDTGIVETQYGYHIMYYVGNDNPETWKTSVKQAVSKQKYDEFDKEILKGDTYAIHKSNAVINWSSKQLQSFIMKQYIKY
ncbi:MAG: peptidylprolyl isomerase [Oscillospiraceae bacterium]